MGALWFVVLLGRYACFGTGSALPALSLLISVMHASSCISYRSISIPALDAWPRLSVVTKVPDIIRA